MPGTSNGIGIEDMNTLTTHTGEWLSPIEAIYQDEKGNKYELTGEVRFIKPGEYYASAREEFPNAFPIYATSVVPMRVLRKLK